MVVLTDGWTLDLFLIAEIEPLEVQGSLESFLRSRFMRKFSLCTIMLSLGLVASSSSAATSVTRYKMKGNSASGLATQSDDCINAGLFVSASDETTKDGTGTTSSRSAFVSYGGSDACNSLSFGGTLQLPLTVSLATPSVTLSFDIPVDYVNTDTDEQSTRHLVGSVTFVATGDFEKSRDTNITQTENMRVVSRSKGNTRDADMTVNAKLDGVVVTFQPSTGSLGTTKQGNVEITRY